MKELYCRMPAIAHWFIQETLRFLAFDCPFIDGNNIMSRTLDKRYGVCNLSLISLAVISNMYIDHVEASRMVLQAI